MCFVTTQFYITMVDRLPDEVQEMNGGSGKNGQMTTRMRMFLDSTKNFLKTQGTAANLQITLHEVRAAENKRPGSSGSNGGGRGAAGARRKSCLFNKEDRKILHPVTLTMDQIREYEQAFSKYDVNRDGSISVDELSTLMATIGLKPSVSEVEEMIATVDANNDGVLSVSEFIKLMSRHHNPIVTPQQQYEAIFKVFDADGNGKISSSEFKDTLFSIGQRCNEGEIQELIAEIDNNRDGIISKEEFLSVFLNHGHFPANDAPKDDCNGLGKKEREERERERREKRETPLIMLNTC
eukprot:sb/3467517/